MPMNKDAWEKMMLGAGQAANQQIKGQWDAANAADQEKLKSYLTGQQTDQNIQKWVTYSPLGSWGAIGM